MELLALLLNGASCISLPVLRGERGAETGLKYVSSSIETPILSK